MLNHIIPFNDRHLYRLVEEFIEEYYHSERPHQGFDGDTPVPYCPQAPITQGVTTTLMDKSIGLMGPLISQFEITPWMYQVEATAPSPQWNGKMT